MVHRYASRQDAHAHKVKYNTMDNIGGQTLASTCLQVTDTLQRNAHTCAHTRPFTHTHIHTNYQFQLWADLHPHTLHPAMSPHWCQNYHPCTRYRVGIPSSRSPCSPVPLQSTCSTTPRLLCPSVRRICHQQGRTDSSFFRELSAAPGRCSSSLRSRRARFHLFAGWEMFNSRTMLAKRKLGQTSQKRRGKRYPS